MVDFFELESAAIAKKTTINLSVSQQTSALLIFNQEKQFKDTNNAAR